MQSDLSSGSSDPSSIAQLAQATGGDRRAAQRWLLNTPDERLSPELLAEKRRLLLEAQSRRTQLQPRRNLWRWYRSRGCLQQGLLGCLSIGAALFVLGFCIFASAAALHAPTSSTPSSANTTSASALQWTITNTFSGNGDSQTSMFTVTGNDWRLVWSCAPASFSLGQYNVIIDIDSPGQGLPVFPSAVNTICSANVTGGTTEEYQSGTFYLAVNSEAAWNVKIEQLL